MKSTMKDKLENIRNLENDNFTLKHQVENNLLVQKDLEKQIDSLYKTIEENKERILKFEKENQLLDGDLTIVRDQLETSTTEKEKIEVKLANLETDRLLLKDESEQLKVFELELYNKIVDKDKLLDTSQKEIDRLIERGANLEKTQQKLIRKLENAEKNSLTQEKQHNEQVASLNKIIKNQANDIQELQEKVEKKQEDFLQVKQLNTSYEVQINNLNYQVTSVDAELSVYKENDKVQKEEVADLNSKLK